jgi:Flp pilus assembly CpaE family ATPase
MVLLLVSQNVSALRLGAAGLGAFRHYGLDLKKVKLVVMCERTGEDVTLKQVREMLGIPIYWTVPSDYATVVAAINSGKPLVTALPRSKIAKSLAQMSNELAGQQSPEASGGRLLSLRRLLGSPTQLSLGVK